MSNHLNRWRAVADWAKTARRCSRYTSAGTTPHSIGLLCLACIAVVFTTGVIFISIKPSLARWKLVEPMRRANSLIKAYIGKDDRLVYVDIDAPMLGDDDKPRPELFRKDGLHLSASGYSLWTQRVRPHLTPIDPDNKPTR